jgi:potassium-transporting ATPase ATP-binding subunit
MKTNNAFNSKRLISVILESIIKLDPKYQILNPVVFIVYLCAIITTFSLLINYTWFNLQISLWLWFTVIFANFAEAMAEGRGKAQADAMKSLRVSTIARLLDGDKEIKIQASKLKVGDIVICEAGDIIPGDGDVIEGISSIDESAITGESAPVIRESGGDISAVTGGTRVISDKILIRITTQQGETFLDKMIFLVEGAKRQKTPNEIALTILLSGMTIIFLLAVVTLKPFESYAVNFSFNKTSGLNATTLISLLVCLIPTTIGSLLSAIGISGIDRLTQRNVIAKSGRAVEAAGDVDVLLLDKTGTITLGNRMATEFAPAPGVDLVELARASQLSSLSDETAEGRSIVILAKEQFNLRGPENVNHELCFIPFSAQSKMSGVDITHNGTTRSIRKGSIESIKRFVTDNGGNYPNEVNKIAESYAKEGATPLLVCEGNRTLGVVKLKDIVKGGIKERFERLRKMGIKTVMITGDNPLTAVSIAVEAGVDDFMAEATPEDKLNRIKLEQSQGKLVAMIGDGTNDAPALAQADVGVAMNSGTQAAREAGNMVDLDSNPTKLIDVVEIGKQMLMTRGALTTFSIANDAAKYFAILPAVFTSLYAQGSGNGPLAKLNIMGLASPESAILSSIIFNALIIVALIPLALKGVKYEAKSANRLLLNNILIYGLGGLIAPFIGIKLIDLIVNYLNLV